MLYLIGLGLALNDLSLKELGAIEKSKRVYLESYTISFPYGIKELESFLTETLKRKIEIIPANRELIENNLHKILLEAKKIDVALLVYGDPLAATTHSTILKEAEKLRLKTKVFHNISIFNAISETGLHLYKFGKTASIPKWQDNFKATSFFDIVKENLSIDAHTLLLVDIGLELKQALVELDEASKQALKDKKIIVVSCLGTPNQKIIYGTIKEFFDKVPDISEPFSIVVPSSLHFSEKEMLERFEKI